MEGAKISSKYNECKVILLIFDNTTEQKKTRAKLSCLKKDWSIVYPCRESCDAARYHHIIDRLYVSWLTVRCSLLMIYESCCAASTVKTLPWDKNLCVTALRVKCKSRVRQETFMMASCDFGFGSASATQMWEDVVLWFPSWPRCSRYRHKSRQAKKNNTADT